MCQKKSAAYGACDAQCDDPVRQNDFGVEVMKGRKATDRGGIKADIQLMWVC